MKLLLISICLIGSFSHALEKFNVRANPFIGIRSTVGLELDVPVSSNWTLGPAFSYWKYVTNGMSGTTKETAEAYNIQSYSIGLRANWAKYENFYDGVYVSPYLKYVHVDLTTQPENFALNYVGKSNSLIAGCTIGYAWFWTNFNQMLGAGLNLPLGDYEVKAKDKLGIQRDVIKVAEFSSLVFEYTLGWVF